MRWAFPSTQPKDKIVDRKAKKVIFGEYNLFGTNRMLNCDASHSFDEPPELFWDMHIPWTENNIQTRLTATTIYQRSSQIK